MFLHGPGTIRDQSRGAAPHRRLSTHGGAAGGPGQHLRGSGQMARGCWVPSAAEGSPALLGSAGTATMGTAETQQNPLVTQGAVGSSSEQGKGSGDRALLHFSQSLLNSGSEDAHPLHLSTSVTPTGFNTDITKQRCTQ